MPWTGLIRGKTGRSRSLPTWKVANDLVRPAASAAAATQGIEPGSVYTSRWFVVRHFLFCQRRFARIYSRERTGQTVTVTYEGERRIEGGTRGWGKEKEAETEKRWSRKRAGHKTPKLEEKVRRALDMQKVIIDWRRVTGRFKEKVWQDTTNKNAVGKWVRKQEPAEV